MDEFCHNYVHLHYLPDVKRTAIFQSRFFKNKNIQAWALIIQFKDIL